MGYRANRRSSSARCWSYLKRAARLPGWPDYLDISTQTIYTWRRQDRITCGLETGVDQ